MNDTWALCCTTNAPADVVNEFLSRHLALQDPPAEIFVFLDQPDMTDKEALVADERIRLFQCDDDFWKEQFSLPQVQRKFGTLDGKRIEGIENRQRYGFLIAYDLTSADWIAMVDVDELFYSKGQIGAHLSNYPDNVFSVRAQPLEAIFEEKAPSSPKELFTTPYFRSRMHWSGNDFWSKYYSDTELSNTGGGFFGHIWGKSFVRTRRDLGSLWIHVPEPEDPSLLVGALSTEIYLLHFEALTPELFVDKVLGRVSKRYDAQSVGQIVEDNNRIIAHVYDSEGFDGIVRIYNIMHVFRKDMLNQILNMDLAVDIRTPFEDALPKVRTWHGTYVAAAATGEVLNLPGDVIRSQESKFQFVNCVLSFHSKTVRPLAYLFVVRDGQSYPLVVDRKKHLRVSSYPSKFAHFFTLVRLTGNRFALQDQYSQSYCQAIPPRNSRDNEALITVQARGVKGWETFEID